MELDVTRFIEEHDMWDFAASVAELGPRAAQITWDNAIECDVKFVTRENSSEIVDYFADFGAWSRDELSEMSENELNALLLQFVAGAWRELDAGGEPCSLYQADDESWWYYVGI